jgi:hypothetical protein
LSPNIVAEHRRRTGRPGSLRRLTGGTVEVEAQAIDIQQQTRPGDGGLHQLLEHRLQQVGVRWVPFIGQP